MANSKTQTEIIVRNSGYVTLKKVVDDRDGVLCIAEGGRDVPFDIKRVYYVTHLENNHSVRGKHAHRALWQAIFCVNGSFMLGLDDGANRQEVLMWQTHVGVLLGPGLWHTMHSFSSGCVFLVAASDYYNEADYIRDYQEFLDFVRGEQA
ncbi:MAG: FdtA/QdtA family cupin domain-containing protein [Kiritimatiellae bacterium]|nr:FdtA/QdtA family cupin domain-containing protein [Kiritimatiellia bacterium]MDD3584521.1 FdtA/QdtA family cupin domain-containing protein [Kiritimatiellia bacterium]